MSIVRHCVVALWEAWKNLVEIEYASKQTCVLFVCGFYIGIPKQVYKILRLYEVFLDVFTQKRGSSIWFETSKFVLKV